MLNEEQCWQAVLSRDRLADGHFYFGVTTTGIYCRPSCAARRPRRENVLFFPDPRTAESQGLRPCKRCHPLDKNEDKRVEQVRELCTFIEQNCDSGEKLTLEILSRQSGLSPSRLRRIFSDIVGVTPRQYVESCRFRALKQGLRDGQPVTRAIYEAGFASSSRVYEQVATQLGMTPGEYREGGDSQAISFAVDETEFGRLLVAATDRGLCFIAFGDTEEELTKRLREEYPVASLKPMQAEGSTQFKLWMKVLREHLAGRQPHLDLPVDVRASAFRVQVWKLLQSIPYGETRTYSEIARALGKPRAHRAVANACAANQVAILIPCHRVIRTDGSLGGYRWGLERKKELLATERRAAHSVIGTIEP